MKMFIDVSQMIKNFISHNSSFLMLRVTKSTVKFFLLIIPVRKRTMEISEFIKSTHILSHKDSYFEVYCAESLGRLWCKQNPNAAKTRLYFCGAVSIDYPQV